MGRIRTLPERHGRVVLVLLGLILAVGLGLRLIGVFDPIDSSYQGADAARYERIAALLYTDQRFAVPGSDAPYDWSPGAPLFYAGIYYVTGGVHPALGRLAIALLGLVTIVICYLLGRRLNGPATGLVAALLAATYPAFVFNTGRLLSEPLAEVTVPGAVLAFLWALDQRSRWAWLAPGVLIGLSALVRPEYLLFGLAFALLALIKRGPGARARPRRRLRAADRAVGDPRLERGRPLRAGHHRRRQGAVHRLLPARRRHPRPREDRADGALPGDARRHARAARAAADGAAAGPRRRAVPGPAARRGAEPDRAREPRAATRASSRWRWRG